MFKQTKKALLLSVLMLVVCLSMLLGTTYAWFTDSASSDANIIQAGNLDVKMEWAVGTADPATTSWNATEGTEAQPIFNNNKWEPGYAEVRHIKISNKGSLALKYKVLFKANGQVSDLANVIDVYYADPAVKVSSKVDLANMAKLGTLTQVLASLGETGNGELLADQADTITLALVMQETAGNEYAGKSIGDSFTIQVLATQLSDENDSFGKDYDKDAEYEGEISTASALVAALNKGGTYRIEKDIEFSNAVEIPAGVEVTLDLNGKTLSGNMHKNVGAVIKNNGTLIIKNGTISSTANNGGSALSNNGTASVIDVVLNGAPNADGSWPSYTINNTGVMTLDECKVTSYHGSVASYGEGAKVTMNNSEIDMAGIKGFTSHGIYTYNNGKVIVNGGTYANKATDQNASGASVVNGNVEINAGTFNGRIENYYGTPVIKGGTFSVKPNNNFVAKGYEVVDNGNGTWTVQAYKVENESQLKDAIAAGKVVELTQDINLGKIDLTGASTNDVVINANGHKITTTDSYGIEVTAGKNITISNAEVVMTKAGDYLTYAAGFKIANGDYAGKTITLENCTITMANTDWAYAINMPASVKNLNLVINNCTLEGAIAVQCWGDNNNVTITNSKLICNYTTNALYTSYCVVLQSDGTNIAENNTFVIDNCEFEYSGIDNFNSTIYGCDDLGNENTVTITNCTYGEKVAAK